jgi:hypothetical protein
MVASRANNPRSLCRQRKSKLDDEASAAARKPDSFFSLWTFSYGSRIVAIRSIGRLERQNAPAGHYRFRVPGLGPADRRKRSLTLASKFQEVFLAP